jgi:thymidylate kinase
MEYKTQALSSPVPTSAAGFFAGLNEAGVRYGVFKSSRNMLVGLAGSQDLDILVDRADHRRFCAIASEYGGIRSVNHSSLTAPEREDWFIPDFDRGRFLHLDVHTSIRLGGKFNKRYRCGRYADIRQWDSVTFEGCPIPVASAQDEAGITLSRIAFRADGKAAGSWQKLGGGWLPEIDDLLFAGADCGQKAVWYASDGLKVRYRVKKVDNAIWVHRQDLASIRHLVRIRSGGAFHTPAIDWIVNAVRASHYAISRAMNRAAPGVTMDRRRPASGGLVIAIVAPDGMGKSTQVERMAKLFGWKFCCMRLYLGTGDGPGWWLRRMLRKQYISRRGKIRAALLADDSRDNSAGPKSRAGSLVLSAWGVLVGLERYSRLRAARRKADRGFIVFCDRWPQSVQAGYMDGPTAHRPGERAGLLRRWELSLYDRMACIHPDLMIHLTGDYAISQGRKPGELSREEFDKRIALMAEIRARVPSVRVVDASGQVDDVSKSLFGLIWNAL